MTFTSGTADAWRFTRTHKKKARMGLGVVAAKFPGICDRAGLENAGAGVGGQCPDSHKQRWQLADLQEQEGQEPKLAGFIFSGTHLLE